MSPRSGLVDIVREFLEAYRLTREIAERYRAGELNFETVKRLVGDDESCVLFRLKERSHSSFRPSDPSRGLGMPHEALFDLAVGSLFHEAMKFRETFYQREVYGPKVRALRDELGRDAEDLFREFEKILSAASVRLDEALAETEILLAQTRDQFRVLLKAHHLDGFTTRYMIEHAEEVAQVFDGGLDALLAQIHGDAASGYEIAAHSYLRSGYFAEACKALDAAVERDGARTDTWQELAFYAQGMNAYLDGEYEPSLDHLERWLDTQPSGEEVQYARLALDALSRVDQLVAEPERERVAGRAAQLVLRLRDLVGVDAEPTTSVAPHAS